MVVQASAGMSNNSASMALPRVVCPRLFLRKRRTCQGGIYHLQLLPLLGATLKQFLPQDIHHGKITNIPHVIHIGHLRFLRQAIQEAANFIAARFESLFELRYPRILRNCVGSFQSSSNLDLEQRGFLCSTSDGMWRLKVRLSPPDRRYIALRCN
jgi:hypothetical protein